MMSWINTFIHKTLKRPYTLAKIYDTGKGEPIVLLHGIASSSLLWKPLLEEKDASLRLVAYDLLGFGDSPKPDWMQYNVGEHAKSVERSIKKLRIRGPITLVGHSMGCLVALHTAYANPKLVKRLVLYEPPFLIDAPDNKQYDRRKRAYMRAFGYIASRQSLVTKYSRYFGKWVNRITAFDLSDEEWVPFERSLRHTIMQQEAYEELAQLSIPTDVVYGRKDRMVIRKDADKLFKHYPHVTQYLINEAHGLTKKSASDLLNIIAPKPTQHV